MATLRELKHCIDAGEEVLRGDENNGYERVDVTPQGDYRWDDGHFAHWCDEWEDLMQFTEPYADFLPVKHDWRTEALEREISDCLNAALEEVMERECKRRFGRSRKEMLDDMQLEVLLDDIEIDL